MNLLVILTAELPGGTVQIKRSPEFGPGTTRTQVYNWALHEAQLDGQRTGEYVVTFFYAEPDEVAA